MYPIMESIASLLSRKLNIYKINQQSNSREVLYLSVTGINKFKIYFKLF